MKRRDFLVGLSAGAVVSVTGPSVVAAERWDVTKLTDAMSVMFNCQEGTKASVVDVMTRTGRAVPLPEFGQEPAAGTRRYHYETYAVTIYGTDEKLAEHELCKYLYEGFARLKKQKNLVWRRKPTLYAIEQPWFGNVWMTREQFEDSRVPLTMPDGVVEAPDGKLRYVTFQHGYSVSTRLVFINGDKKERSTLFVEEGAPRPVVSV